MDDDILLGSFVYTACLLSCFSCVQLCATPYTEAHQAPPSLGFSRQEHWSGLPFLLQCMKVKSESEVAKLCPTLSDPMDCSLPGSSIHGIFQARVLEWLNRYFAFVRASLIAQMVKESTRNAGDPSLIPGLGRSPGGSQTVRKYTFNF